MIISLLYSSVFFENMLDDTQEKKKYIYIIFNVREAVGNEMVLCILCRSILPDMRLMPYGMMKCRFFVEMWMERWVHWICDNWLKAWVLSLCMERHESSWFIAVCVHWVKPIQYSTNVRANTEPILNNFEQLNGRVRHPSLHTTLINVT